MTRKGGGHGKRGRARGKLENRQKAAGKGVLFWRSGNGAENKKEKGPQRKKKDPGGEGFSFKEGEESGAAMTERKARGR